MSYGTCSPNVDVLDHYTCFKHDELKIIANEFNNYIETNKTCPKSSGVKKDKDTLGSNKCNILKSIDINNKTKRELWYSIYNRLNYICPYEYCWIDLDFIKNIKDKKLRDKIKFFTFKPKMTKTRESWLNTKDINNVLQQYQNLFVSFKFLGALPADFYKVTDVDYRKIFNYEKVGMVFNLDNHNQSGSHWVAFLIDNKSKTLEYYDSVGKLPNKNIQTFINKVYKYLKSKGHNYKKLYNKKQHQSENSECGVYAIYFLIQRLLNFDFKTITNNIITDKQMNDFRSVIFRPR
jgi:hypothetical protein